MLNHSHAFTYDDQCPILRISEFTSVYCICDPHEGNVHMVIRKRELLVSTFRKFVVTLLKTGKLSIIGMSEKC